MTMSGILGVGGGGGTGLSSIADGALLFGSGGIVNLTALATSTPGSVLQIDFTTGRPVWVATSTLGISGGSIAPSHPTFQTLTNTSISTYTTPANVTELYIKICAGGGHDSAIVPSGVGGPSPFGGGGVGGKNATGQNGATNSCSGASGGYVNQGGGGGAGEYAEFSIVSPSSSYNYAVGIGGSGGGSGDGAHNGGAGADGIIIVEEFYR